jgi:hypothetical protein
MSDEQDLRDALRSAIPEPPDHVTSGLRAREQRRRNMRRRIGAVAVAAAAVALAVSLNTALRTDRSGPALPVLGQGGGMTACHRLDGKDHLGTALDSRVVDGQTASTWLNGVAPSLESSPYDAASQVTICLMQAHIAGYTVLVQAPGLPTQVVMRGGYVPKGGVVGAMLALDRLWKGGSQTVEASFTCAGARHDHERDVSTTLPDGAIAARICFDDGSVSPPQPLTTGVDDLVDEINASSVYYSPPDFTCSPPPGLQDYWIQFQYKSGTRTVEEQVCRGLAVGPYTRGGGSIDDLQQTFLSRLASQVRDGSGPVSAPACRPFTSNRPIGVGDVRELVAARYCASGTTGAGQVLRSTRFRTLRGWGHQLMGGVRTEPEGRCPPPIAGRPRLELVDAWGDTFTMTVVECDFHGTLREYPAVRSSGHRHPITFPLSERTNELTALLLGLGHTAR